jgi:hypothetical protein
MTQLSTIYVHDTVHRGRAHLGVALRASWGSEHGAGGDAAPRPMVSVVGHDSAWLEWSEKDAESRRRKP